MQHDHARGKTPRINQANAAAPAPGRTTLHEPFQAVGQHERAVGSVFDAYQTPDHLQPLLDEKRDEHAQHDKHAHHDKHDKHDKHAHRDKHDKHAADDARDNAEADEDLDEDTAEASASNAGKHHNKGGADDERHAGAKAKHGSGGEIHIITRAGLRHLRQGGRQGRHAAQVLYNNRNAYIVLKQGQTIPRGWKANATILFPSYTEFEAAVNAGRMPQGIDAVVYDNEHWDQTPGYEKTNAVHYAKLFGELAHRLGMVYIAAPTRKWFAADARFADIIDVQLQSREVHTGSYEGALRHDAKLAHHLNPDIKVVTQMSSNKNHLDPDHSGNIDDGIHKAERDIVQTAPYVDGFWGYLYQQNSKSIHAGQRILTDLAHKRERGVKI